MTINKQSKVSGRTSPADILTSDFQTEEIHASRKPPSLWRFVMEPEWTVMFPLSHLHLPYCSPLQT